MDIRQITTDKATACRTILAALPHWFGIAALVDNYVRAAETATMFGAYDDDHSLVGMVTLVAHSRWNHEITAMGVLPDFHRLGFGRLLVEASEDFAQLAGARALTVKTLSSKDPDEGYKRTRSFYESVGFELFEEMPDLWDPDNPAVIYIKPL